MVKHFDPDRVANPSLLQYRFRVALKTCQTTESFLETAIVRVRFEVFTAVTMKSGVFWDVTLYGSCKNLRFGGT
jgi:hypothetical protein